MTAQIAAHGRLVADVQIRTTSNGINMAFTRMAVALPCQKAESGEAVLWLGVLAFGRQADALAVHQKGDPLCVSGVMQVNQWTGQDGGIQQGWQVLADSVISARAVTPGAGKGKSAGTTQQRQAGPDPEDYDQTPRYSDDAPS